MLALIAAATVLVHGVVMIGPTTPVCRQGTPCSKPAAHVVIEFTRYGHLTMATTDAQGRYSVRLIPGTWNFKPTRGLRWSPTRFVVRKVVSQRRDFAIDTGIR